MRIILFVLLSPILYPSIALFAENTFCTNAITDTNYFGNAYLSYTINGKKTSIKNLLQTKGQNIKALHLNVVGPIAKTELLRINFTNSLTHEVFDFVVANKGTTLIRHYKPSLTVKDEQKAAYMSPQLVNYYADNCKIDITIADGKHIVGKFAGQFISDNGKHIDIKDGSFDVPVNENK